jgi:hypothetical protein
MSDDLDPVPVETVQLAREFADLCRINYFYKRKTDPTGGAVLAGLSAVTTILSAIIASPVALFGVPMLAAGAFKMAESEDECFNEIVWKRIHDDGVVQRSADGSLFFHFAIDGRACILMANHDLPTNRRAILDVFFFTATFSSERILRLVRLI